MLSFPVLTHKNSQRARKDAPISFWKLKHVFETNPPPSLWEKASSHCSAHLRVDTQRIWPIGSLKRLKIPWPSQWLYPAVKWSSISETHGVTLSDFQQKRNAEHFRFSFSSTLSEEVFDLGLITEGSDQSSSKGWWPAKTGAHKRSQEAKIYTHSLFLGRQ